MAYYLPEKKSAVTQQVLRQEKTIQIIQLTEIEIQSALKKKIRIGNIDERKARETYQKFYKHKKQYAFQVFELTNME